MLSSFSVLCFRNSDSKDLGLRDLGMRFRRTLSVSLLLSRYPPTTTTTTTITITIITIIIIIIIIYLVYHSCMLCLLMLLLLFIAVVCLACLSLLLCLCYVFAVIIYLCCLFSGLTTRGCPGLRLTVEGDAAPGGRVRAR